MEALLSYISFLPFIVCIIIWFFQRNIGLSIASSFFVASFFTMAIFSYKGISIQAIVASVSIFLLYKYNFFKRNNNSFLIKSYYAIFIIAVIFFISNLIFCSETKLSARETLMVSLKNICPFVLSLVIVSFINTIRETSFVVKVILIIASISSVYSIYCYYLGYNPFTIFTQTMFDFVIDKSETERGELLGRAQGFQSHPLYLAGALLCTLYIAQLFMIYTSKKMGKIFILISIVLCVYAMTLTGTRSAIVAAGIGFGLYYAIISGKKLPLYIVLLVGIFYIFEIDTYINSDKGSLLYAVTHIFEQNDEIGGSSVELRLQQLNGTFDMVFSEIQTCLFGKGTNWCYKYSDLHGLHPVLAGFESILFKWPIEYGIVGFMLFLSVVFIKQFYIFNTNFKMTKGVLFFKCSIVSFLIFTIMTGHYAIDLFVISIALMANLIYLIEFKNKTI